MLRVNVDAIGDGARWALTAVFVLAAIEKSQTLGSGAASWHPVMLASSVRRQWARGLMAGSLLADVVAVVLLIAWPLHGAVIAALLVVTYSIAAANMNVHSGRRECRCMWKLMNASSRRGLVIRNALLILLSGLIVAASPGRSLYGFTWGAIIVTAVHGATRIADWQGLAPEALVPSASHAPSSPGTGHMSPRIEQPVRLGGQRGSNDE